MVVQECTFEGTHTGSFDGPAGIIPPTGRKVVVKCVQIGRYENGLATDVRLYYDQIDLLTQLGLLREHVVILMEKTNDRYLPIWIGTSEANAIAMKIQGMTPERPITHDLIRPVASFLTKGYNVLDN